MNTSSSSLEEKEQSQSPAAAENECKAKEWPKDGSDHQGSGASLRYGQNGNHNYSNGTTPSDLHASGYLSPFGLLIPQSFVTPPDVYPYNQLSGSGGLPMAATAPTLPLVSQQFITRAYQMPPVQPFYLQPLHAVSVANVQRRGESSVRVPGAGTSLAQLNTEHQSVEPQVVKKQQRNVYIKNLPADATNDSLKALCQSFGNVESAKAILEQQELKSETGQLLTQYGKCKGYGFCLFQTEHEAEKAIAGLQQLGYIASMAKESVSKKLKQLADESTSNVYLSSLPLSVDDDQLKEIGESFGEVMSSRVMVDSNGKSKGVAFIRYASRSSAQAAIDSLHGKLLTDECKIPLQARFADSQSQKQFKKHYANRLYQKMLYHQSPRQE
ncbi:hypothetical protein MIR68_005412 [Amoeboaphelidium protococcarum]|nr:hypothetical protein MIR68_005412 [Amoeboaphelidium protococcarum]